MTRMERRRRRRRIARIKFVTVVAVLAAVGCTVMALSGAEEAGGAEIDRAAAKAAEPIATTLEYQEVKETPEPQPSEVSSIEQDEQPLEENENELIEQALLEQGYFHEEIPLDYDLQAHLIAVCEEYGVPMSVALGVIQAESTFTATAQNGSCYGYMQINSINSGWLEESIGVTDLTDPYQNIRSGVYILSDLYGKYGDWHKALTAYNFGEAGAQKHVFSQGYTTTTYSRTVMAYAEEWEAVLG